MYHAPLPASWPLATEAHCSSRAGGFSVYAGVGGAAHVTTVDIGRAALSYADANWRLNGLDPAAHVSAAVDAFEFLDGASKAREK